MMGKQIMILITLNSTWYVIHLIHTHTHTHDPHKWRLVEDANEGNSDKNSRMSVCFSTCSYLYGSKVFSELFRVGCSQKD